MTVFQSVTDDKLVAQIETARRRLVFAAPGVTTSVARALAVAYERESVAVTVILDSDEEAYRIGYGDADGLADLHGFAATHGMALRRQPGLRLGLLVADDTVVIWAPTARAVEAEPGVDQPNGIVLQEEVATILDRCVSSQMRHG